MGMCGSKKQEDKYRVDGKDAEPVQDAGRSGGAEAGKTGSGNVGSYQPTRPRLDPKDFQFKDLKGEMAVKAPGAINGQAFTIDSCEDCDLYVVDACAQVTIDKAKNCRIFLGPTEGSVFIRDSTNCRVAVVCRQLRTRDCENVDFALFCRTRPIIEASTDMRFSCYDLDYEKLPDHMKAARLDVLHNFWSHVYDFTPKAGNWSLLAADAGGVRKLLGSPELPEAAAAALGSTSPGALLVTWGDRTPPPSPDYMFVVFPPQAADKAMAFAAEASAKAVLLRANKVALPTDTAAAIASAAGWSAKDSKAIAGTAPAAGFEVSGAGCVDALSGSAKAAGAMVTENEDAGSLFRYMGLDG